MRIAMVSEHASPLACLGGVDAGGQNVYVASVAGALARRGHSVVVYTRADSAELPRRVAMLPGVEVEHVPAGPVDQLPKDELLQYMPEFGEHLRRVWARRPPDVVHAHFWMSGVAATAATAGTPIPVIQTFHALGSVKRRWQGDADTSPARRIEIELDLANEVDRIVATCTDEVAELRLMGVEHSRIDVIPCGVDTAVFTPRSDSDPSTGPTPREGSGPSHRLLIVGRLVPRKGIEDAVRALADIPGAKLLIAGGPDAADLDDEPEALRLAAVAAEVGVSDRLRLLGGVSRSDLARLIRSVDLVLSVPWYEPFGIVPVEAMASGTPVVATAVGGMLDTVVDGETGLLVPTRNPAALARAVNELLRDPARRAAMGVASARRAVDCYTWDGIAGRLLTSYAIARRERQSPEDLVGAELSSTSGRTA